ncbi:MAG TPA: SagB/ThcOx family dehydrogenase [Steroidobacteraceae bacterium]|nr:SagB/ThcOx family dehydrogenase [Steroidobacteraceae bacterium]
MRIRRARALALFWREGELVLYNFLVPRALTATPEVLTLLSDAESWREPQFFFDLFPDAEPASVAEQISKLVALGALMVEGSPQAELDGEYERAWEWGVPAGLYHFGVKYQRYATEKETRTLLRHRIKTRPAPSLTTGNAHGDEVVQLPRPRATGVLGTMFARRTERWFGRRPIGAAQLCRCLYGGLGITGFVEDAELGPLPLKMAPSGGARNPYEGYVYVRNVSDVPPGVYHYSGVENSLGLVARPPLPPAAKLLSEQEWTNDAAAVVFLVASFERTNWKYPHPNSYRVIAIEAGHIVQNILLLATEQRLAAAPTAALQEAPLEALLHIDPIRQGVIYAVALGNPAKRRSFSIRRAYSAPTEQRWARKSPQSKIHRQRHMREVSE